MTAGLSAREGAGPIDPGDQDARFMAAALNLARRGLGRVSPNPAVAALIVKDGILVGRGFTGLGGRPHAETLALAAAGDAARGATLYVTLEPCSHHGRTPPCADAIIAAGVSRVVSAMEDPDPRVAGQGHARLHAAGIDVSVGLMGEAAGRLNLGHVLRVTKKRPMLSLKLAETTDGYAAGAAGAARLMITGETANAQVHMWRAMHDAVLIGGGTARADDPLLTVRLPSLEMVKPLRVVLDSQLALSPNARLAATAKDHPTLILTTTGASEEAAAALMAKGIDVLRVAQDAAGHVDLSAALAALAARGVTRVFCEGGPRLAAALLEKGFADAVMILTGASALGAAGLSALDDESRTLLNDASRYVSIEDRLIGPDRLRHYERVL